jgi:hypothetical protein
LIYSFEPLDLSHTGLLCSRFVRLR